MKSNGKAMSYTPAIEVFNPAKSAALPVAKNSN